MTSKKAVGSNKLGRWLGALSRACDSYVHGPDADARGHVRRPRRVSAGDRGGLDVRSRSRGRDGDEDYVNELVRVMSLRQVAAACSNRPDAEVRTWRRQTKVPVRSRSVACSRRIGEFAPCEFGADDVVRVGGPPCAGPVVSPWELV